ncbi:MAG: 4-(cytidine 5'-diphospho)-2-C-methyl-D-erythritol kinase [Candidatus Fluviicola riflensis]|nr:MAG: 4-(cytidine 5'-diphospho)-2-C-methyl-D-erythritol kinase [Candidatus Fluviicola riflensis]OGS78739.1 MAG: 4-(cytidine 5'-diphospho)-2-C-methyl-D-erythritol kinase [Candidatus Fluviicola riflensis]OGS86170.1 MAG: 4-(cytidine 5'-diphospho)-2-C-methyl-D-erythritol kinase [Fluviicola sp. RIFCSPHIGHO2_01_FULL_43_53]OGS87701.1 MAG: 4-(cytidine 5'-diphospho)-2-C-methyl-D-erythritol kinase [Fluviicola sp. RIFCSPHIGHO2_12_FULL_43_24]
MIYFPSCKINLGLHILRKRDDGYHEIETGMLEIPFRDILEIVPSDMFRFTTSGMEIPGNDNSCVAAYDLLKRDFDLPPVHIHLHKMVPMGGGLGGGSSDSTATLKGLNELFQLQLSIDQLKNYASQLGSDNAFFVEGGLQLAKSRGEELQSLDITLPKWHICVVNLGIHVSTSTAFELVTPNEHRTPLSAILQQPVSTWKNELVNDFEPSVFAQHPELLTLKTDLYQAGAIYAAMSGSGSTLFGLFEEKPEQILWSQLPVYEVWVNLK